jgi:hypothetical protein
MGMGESHDVRILFPTEERATAFATLCENNHLDWYAIVSSYYGEDAYLSSTWGGDYINTSTEDLSLSREGNTVYIASNYYGFIPDQVWQIATDFFGAIVTSSSSVAHQCQEEMYSVNDTEFCKSEYKYHILGWLEERGVGNSDAEDISDKLLERKMQRMWNKAVATATK